VKRLLPAFILALGFHAIILNTDFSWLSFAPDPTSAAKSLSITLSADRPQKRRANAAIPQKPPERQRESSLNQKAGENLDAMPAPKVEQSAQPQKQLPAAPPENIVKKPRRKKSLKASTFYKKHMKAAEATSTAPDTKRHIPPKAEINVFNTASFPNKPVHQPLPADTVFTKETRRVPNESSEPAATAAIQPAAQSDDSLSGSVLKIARPLYRQNTAPSYPLKARRMGYEGIVMLKVLVDENGRVGDLAVYESSGHSVLDRAALSAVRKWLFEPGTEGGIKKKMWVKIPVRFDLK